MSIVYRPTIQFTRDECLLFSAVWEHGCREAEARGHDPELDDIPVFIERALNDWPFFRAPDHDQFIARVSTIEREVLIGRITEYVRERFQMDRLAEFVGGSA